MFKREFMNIGNIEVVLLAITFASAFLQPDVFGLITTGVCTCNNKYSKKTLMWLLHIEETDEVNIVHGRNGREYKLPELLLFSVDDYCFETRKIYEFFGCYFHGVTCQPFRDVSTTQRNGMDKRCRLWNK